MLECRDVQLHSQRTNYSWCGLWRGLSPQTHHALLLLQHLQVLHEALVSHIKRCLALAEKRGTVTNRKQTQRSRDFIRELVDVHCMPLTPVTAVSLTSLLDTVVIPSSIPEETQQETANPKTHGSMFCKAVRRKSPHYF